LESVLSRSKLSLSVLSKESVLTLELVLAGALNLDGDGVLDLAGDLGLS